MASVSDDPAGDVGIPVCPISVASPSIHSSPSSPLPPPSPSFQADLKHVDIADASDDSSSIRKHAAPLFSLAGPSAFDRLPDEIIQQILLAVDANSFASLTLLNTKWRLVSQQAHLYAHHLARCPSYAASHKNFLARLAKRRQAGDGSTGDSDGGGRILQELRRDFAREVKRNRFDAYLRPSRTLVRLVSTSISSSSCPGGEGMLFQASPKGHHLLAYNSSRIYVLDLRRPAVQVRRELKILRRPAAVCILDDASVLAVLLTEMQVDLYDLRQSPPRRTQSFILDHSPRAIALSPCGSVLAAAYDGGIEVSSLSSGAMDTDRRSVKCEAVDALAFSFDGTQILGTTVHAAQPNTVILTAPYYDPGSHVAGDDMGALWTTSILFPNTSRDCGHAVLLQDSAREEAFWTFTYDRSFETFRAVRIDDLRNGTTYFTGPIPTTASQARLLPCTLPAASYHGDLVSAGFQDRDIWLYGVPEDLDAVPDSVTPESTAATDSPTASRASGSPSMRAASTRLQEPGNNSASVRVPQWQLLCDKLRNTFVAGYRIGELPGMSMVKWVEGFGDSSLRERLVVCARGVSPPKPISPEGDGMDFIDGGRLLLVDFDYGLTDGKDVEITIEVGTREPEELEEERRDLDTEVAIVRRRTVAQKRGGRGALMRAATIAGAAVAASAMAPAVPSLPTQSLAGSGSGNGNRDGNGNDNDDDDDDDPLKPRRIGAPPARRPNPASAGPANTVDSPAAAAAGTATPAAANEEGAETESILEQEALDAPYSHASPRSGMTLRRAATAAANSRRLNPQPATTTSSGAPITYRRADGRREHPHESDADNWVPPPPPYQKEDPQDLPAFLRHNVAPISAPVSSGPSLPVVTAQARPTHERPRENPSDNINGLGAAGVSAARPSPSRLSSRPVSVFSTHSSEDLYDATPRVTPVPIEQGPRPRSRLSTAQGSTANGTFVGDSSLPPAVPSLLTSSASWNVTVEQQAYGQGHHILKPLESVQTWPLRQPSVSARRSSNENGRNRRGQPGAAADMNISLATTTAAATDSIRQPRRVPVAGFQVARVPVGRARQSRRLSSAATMPQEPNQSPHPNNLYNPQLQLQLQSQAVEDQPLIISTPQGVSGAFDPPLPTEFGGSRQQESQILAPVPRHPRAQERSAMLRERLEILSGGGGDPGQDQLQQRQQQLLSPFNSNGCPSSAATTTRQSSLGRRLSRAERSAAKNIADAKKRGWRRKNSKKAKKGKEVAAEDAAAGPTSRTALTVASLLLPPQSGHARRKKGKGKGKGRRSERDNDVASSAAWTDVTAASVADGTTYYQQHGQNGQRGYVPPVPTGPDSSSAFVMQQMQQQQQQQQQQQYYEQEQQQHQQWLKGKNAKCGIM